MLEMTPVITAQDTIAFNLKKKIEDHTALIGVIGLGYVGLPLAVEKAKVGFKVLGFDINPEKTAKINAGQNYIGDVKDEELKELAANKTLSATTDFNRLSECDVIIICVPTPLTATRDPDISYIKASGEEVAKHLHAGQLVTL
ncbi:MAG: UDP-N-acetyl-D-glucosamine dehydrogenase, partial [Peptococcaceae bacterium]|nr:UDP-N-acetyl-D-glucosamine dehydrogenase [Peptococcaceae bacterium]